MIIYTNSWMKNVAQEIFPEALMVDALLERDRFLDLLPEATAIFGSGFAVTEKFLSQAPKLKIVALTSVGYDHCDLKAMKDKGVILTNTPDILTEATADLGFSLLMSAARRVAESQELIKTGHWTSAVGENLFGVDVFGKTLGIIGMGRIGQAVARRGALGFNMRICYHSREKKQVEYPTEKMELENLLKVSDFVVLTTALTNSTRALIGEKELALMKESAIIINIARGPVIDEEALVSALKNNKIRSAGLDVYNKEPIPHNSSLLELSNVVLTPHIGSATFETREAMARLAGENLELFLAGKNPKNQVLQS